MKHSHADALASLVFALANVLTVIITGAILLLIGPYLKLAVYTTVDALFRFSPTLGIVVSAAVVGWLALYLAWKVYLAWTKPDDPPQPLLREPSGVVEGFWRPADSARRDQRLGDPPAGFRHKRRDRRIFAARRKGAN